MSSEAFAEAGRGVLSEDSSSEDPSSSQEACCDGLAFFPLGFSAPSIWDSLCSVRIVRLEVRAAAAAAVVSTWMRKMGTIAVVFSVLLFMVYEHTVLNFTMR